MKKSWAGLGSRRSTAPAQHQEECGLVPDAAVGQRAVVSELGAAPDQALLGGRDALPVQQHQLDGLDRVAGRHVQREGAARGGLDEDLHACRAWPAPWACVSACAERLRRRRGVGGLAQRGLLERARRRRSCCSDDRGSIVWVSGWGVQVSVGVSVRVSVQNSVCVSVRVSMRVSVRVSVWVNERVGVRVSVRVSVRVGVRVSVRVSLVLLGLGRAAPGRPRGEGLAPPTR